MVQNALKHFHGGRYYLHAWCVMPNHVHVVYTALPGHSPKDIHHSWNSYTAHQANKILTRSGTFWEAEGFDHLIRSIDDLQWFIEYTENNPVAAGLCRNKDDWRWSSAGSRWNPRAACGAGVRPAVSARTEAAGTAAPQQLAGETPAPQIWNERTFLQVQAVQLRELLRQAGDDPILVPQLSQRLADVEDELKALNSYRAAVSGVVSFAARGVFRGLTRESRIFDLVADDAKLITGTIAANLREEDLDRIAGLTNQRCLASLQKATFCQGGVWQESYLLLNVVRDDGGNG